MQARRWISRLAKLAFVLLLGLYLFWVGALIALRYIDPPGYAGDPDPTRRVEAMFSGTPYRKRYKFIALGRISPEFAARGDCRRGHGHAYRITAWIGFR